MRSANRNGSLPFVAPFCFPAAPPVHAMSRYTNGAYASPLRRFCWLISKNCPAITEMIAITIELALLRRFRSTSICEPLLLPRLLLSPFNRSSGGRKERLSSSSSFPWWSLPFLRTSSLKSYYQGLWVVPCASSPSERTDGQRAYLISTLPVMIVVFVAMMLVDTCHNCPIPNHYCPGSPFFGRGGHTQYMVSEED